MICYHIRNKLSIPGVCFHFSCSMRQNRTCVLPSSDFVCNGSITCLNTNPCEIGCDSHYQCAKTSFCVARSTVCDRDACNGSPNNNEWEHGIGFKCVRNARNCILPQELLHDQVKDCDNGEDFCFRKEGYALVNFRNTFISRVWWKCCCCQKVLKFA